MLSITILCGGRSAEHDISLLSAKNVIAALDPAKYAVTVLYINPSGQWYWVDHQQASWPHQAACQAVQLSLDSPQHPWVLQEEPDRVMPVDCVIPMVHGTQGEDGTIQGLLEALRVPYVGSDVSSSALCMQKQLTKSLLRLAHLPTSDWFCFSAEEAGQFPYERAKEWLGKILFIKPSALGSSIASVIIDNSAAYTAALEEAFQYDTRVMVEPYIQGREIECSVLGGDHPIASLPGEIITSHPFYSYEAKYGDPQGTTIATPADLSESEIQKIQHLATAAFKVLQCHGMARVDFFLSESAGILINEVNTIPGFTRISLYPKNWEVSGLSYTDLLDRLIQLALEKHHCNMSYLRTPPPFTPVAA